MGVKTTFAIRLKELRGNIPQNKFGERIGVSRGSISYYENGTRTADIEILEKLCRAYDVSADWLLGIPDPKEKVQVVIKPLEGYSDKELLKELLKRRNREP